MESQPQNPEFRINPENFTLNHLINAHGNDIKCLSVSDGKCYILQITFSCLFVVC